MRVIPRAARSRIDGMRAGALLVRLAAPPVEGAANDALVTLLGVPRRSVRLIAGERSRNKRVVIDGRTEVEIRERLQPWLKS